MEILGIHIRLKTHVSSTHRLLFEQSHLHGQIHEDTQEFDMRDQTNSETTPIQILHTCQAWFTLGWKSAEWTQR